LRGSFSPHGIALWPSGMLFVINRSRSFAVGGEGFFVIFWSFSAGNVGAAGVFCVGAACVTGGGAAGGDRSIFSCFSVTAGGWEVAAGGGGGGVGESSGGSVVGAFLVELLGSLAGGVEVVLGVTAFERKTFISSVCPVHPFLRVFICAWSWDSVLNPWEKSVVKKVWRSSWGTGGDGLVCFFSFCFSSACGLGDSASSL